MLNWKKEAEGSGGVLIRGRFSVFALKDRGNTENLSVRIDVVSAKIRSGISRIQVRISTTTITTVTSQVV
jgi:hypothetical protein